ncbi:MAG: Lrp/AsnC ligand binding domain-containing protein [Candidatus Helarchaeota archaeon]
MTSIAFVMLNVQAGKIKEILKKIKEIPEVIETYSITGPKDIILRIESDENLEKLAKIVVSEIHEIKGVISSETYFVINL